MQTEATEKRLQFCVNSIKNINQLIKKNPKFSKNSIFSKIYFFLLNQQAFAILCAPINFLVFFLQAAPYRLIKSKLQSFLCQSAAFYILAAHILDDLLGSLFDDMRVSIAVYQKTLVSQIDLIPCENLRGFIVLLR